MVDYLCRLAVCGRVEREHSSKVEIGLWVSYDIKIMLFSLSGTSASSGQAFPWDAVCQPHTHRSAIMLWEAYSAVVKCQVTLVQLLFFQYLEIWSNLTARQVSHRQRMFSLRSRLSVITRLPSSSVL